MIKFSELNTAKSCEGLVPAIIQDDDTRQVLMLGYLNEEAFDKTVAEGRVTFFSRTKGRLWTKGETSGNYLHVKSIAKDCDADTLLIRVVPAGPVYQRLIDEYDSLCRAVELFPDHLLQSVIRQRHRDMPEGSYTTKLFTKGAAKIAQKVGEEAVETVIEAVANNNPDLVYEASDLIYHLLVLLENQGLSIADLEEELAKRHK